MIPDRHIVWQHALVSRDDRESLRRHKGALLWITGLSGSGKTTLAHAIDARLHALGLSSYVLDGDNVRHGLCADLGFDIADRVENIRRVGEVAKLFVDAGLIAISAFISPFQADRDRIRSSMHRGDFLEIFCDCPLEVCESRDVKGLYKQARQGRIKGFTGIDSPYEAPPAADLRLDTAALSVEECVARVMHMLENARVIEHREG